MPIFLQKPNGVTYQVRRAYNSDDLLFVRPIGGVSNVFHGISDSGGEFTAFIPCAFFLKVRTGIPYTKDTLDFWDGMIGSIGNFYYTLNKFYDKEG